MITLATCNLLNYLAPPGAFYDFSNILTLEEWQKKQTWLKQKLLEINADVLAFQEVFSPDELQQLCQTLGYGHFAVVDQPDVSDEFIYTSPVLALASRYPLLSVEPVVPESQQLTLLGANGEFTFSRTPLHAVVDFPHLGPCHLIVVHFKSQRPTMLQNGADDAQMRVAGSWLSTIQRGWEALLLRQYLVEIYLNSEQPMVVLGDFNTHLNSMDLRPLLDTSQTPLMQDIRQLVSSADTQTWPPTHYHGELGLTIDYILLSEEFFSSNAEKVAEISRIAVWDQHLVSPNFADDQFASDHAFVSVTLLLT
ncbi:endonuclease/exonuclease/phosphatase family protein [Vibrio navarrensis]|uniref:Endonuclease/exonuclease/phosphatase family protein n=1 Tax=Vibrio navarrensis TaxID=29495 RepID=A0AAJ4LWL6_9VIBR|nr:endonuclease/exonuclease/phosphatase family protein [Vibrio navarrensis]